MSAYKSNLYIDPAMNIIGPSTHVLDFGVSMSSKCTFDFHISNLYKQCSNLAFTKHISGMCFLSYSKRLEVLKLCSLQSRRERYGIIYVWKIVEGLVPNRSDPITCSFSDRRGRTCVVCHSGAGRLGTLKYNSFRSRSIRMFNRLPKAIRMLSSCSVVRFKSQLDSYLRNIVDLPCQPGFNNSLDGGDCLHGGHSADDLAAN